MFLFFSVTKTTRSFLPHWDCDCFMLCNLEKYPFVSRISKIWLTAPCGRPAHSTAVRHRIPTLTSILCSLFSQDAFPNWRSFLFGLMVSSPDTSYAKAVAGWRERWEQPLAGGTALVWSAGSSLVPQPHGAGISAGLSGWPSWPKI